MRNVYIFLIQFFEKHKNAKEIASIGCGSVIELDFYLSRNKSNTIETIHLFDRDQGALDLATKKLEKFNKKIVIHKGNILKSIFKASNNICDLAYSSGLFDYFDIKSSDKLMNKIWTLIKPEGHLCIVNANPKNPSKFWMEYAMDWYLEYKEMNEFMQVFIQLNNIQEYVLRKDSLGIYQYSYLKKDLK